MTTRRILAALPVLLIGWVAVMAVVMRFSDAAPAAVVVFPSAALVDALPTGTAIIAHSRISLTLTSDTTGFAKSLYRHGAWLVLAAGLPGCLPLPKTG